MREVLLPFLQMTKASDGQVIVLAGKFVTDRVETFFLPTSMGEPGPLKLYQRAVPLSLYLAVLRNAPAGGMLVLAPANSTGESGPNWDWGLGPLSAPENVAIVHGTPRAVAGFVRDVLPNPAVSPAAAVAATPALSAVGTLPDAPFLAPGDALERVRDALAWSLPRVSTICRAIARILRTSPTVFMLPKRARKSPHWPRQPRPRSRPSLA